MISLILKSVGRLFLGPVMKTVDKYFQGRTDRHRIDGDVTINRDSIRGETTIAQVTADASVDIAAIEASAAIAGKQPMLITIIQAVIYSVAALYYLALVVVSIIPDSHAWTVRSLPDVWELVTLAILAAAAGPQILQLLRKRLGL